MVNTGTFNQGVNKGQKNPNAKTATPQQIPNATKRQDYNNGLKKGQKGK